VSGNWSGKLDTCMSILVGQTVTLSKPRRYLGLFFGLGFANASTYFAPAVNYRFGESAPRRTITDPTDISSFQGASCGGRNSEAYCAILLAIGLDAAQ